MLLYLVHGEGLSSVFQSMVVRTVEQVRRRGYAVRLLVFAPLGEFIRPRLRRQWKTTRQVIDGHFRGPFSRLPSPPERLPGCWNEAALLSRFIKSHYGRDRCVVVHCRGEKAAALAIRIRQQLPNIRTVYDMRGLHYAEYGYEGDVASSRENDSAPVRSKAAATRAIEMRAARDCDAMLCVSQRMADHVKREFAVPDAKIVVVPNHVPVDQYHQHLESRDRIRQQLGLSDRFVVSYSGSLHPWQLPARGLELFRHMQQLEPSAHYLVFTHEPEQMRALVRESRLEPGDVTVLRIGHFDVPRYLVASDVGLITRGLIEGPRLADQVSCPVKFGEYLASGVPVIMSERVGDCSELLRRERVGVALPPGAADRAIQDALSGFLDSLKESPQSWRDRCHRTARRYLDSERHLAKVTAVYDKLAG